VWMNKDDAIFVLFYAAVFGPFFTYMLMSSHYNKKLSRMRSEQGDSAVGRAGSSPDQPISSYMSLGYWTQSRIDRLERRVQRLEYADAWLRGLRDANPEKYGRNPSRLDT
jgi:hypothetical protein